MSRTEGAQRGWLAALHRHTDEEQSRSIHTHRIKIGTAVQQGSVRAWQEERGRKCETQSKDCRPVTVESSPKKGMLLDIFICCTSHPGFYHHNKNVQQHTFFNYIPLVI